MAKEIISESRLREIISEETKRFKKKLALEAEKKTLLKKLNEMYMEDQEPETLNEWGEFRKAESDFSATNAQGIADMNTAYKANDPSYVDKSTALMGKVKAEYIALATKYGISGTNDLGVLYKSLMKIAQPMDFNTFNRQVSQGGSSLSDIGSGTGIGKNR